MEKNSTYDAISDHYVDFVNKNYPNAIVIFDGYESGPSTKDMTHQRRSVQVMSPVINFTGNMALSFSKDKFLSNNTNKQNIINLIGKKLQITGCNAVFSQEDAAVTVVGEDTDLLILLLYYYSKQSDFQLLFQSDKHAKTKDVIKHNINFYSNMLGPDLCRALLFLHSFTGCDTTPGFYGKSTSFKLFLNSPRLLQLASILLKPDHSSDDIKNAGEEVATILNRGNCNDDFGMLRKQISAKNDDIEIIC